MVDIDISGDTATVWLLTNDALRLRSTGWGSWANSSVPAVLVEPTPEKNSDSRMIAPNSAIEADAMHELIKARAEVA